MTWQRACALAEDQMVKGIPCRAGYFTFDKFGTIFDTSGSVHTFGLAAPHGFFGLHFPEGTAVRVEFGPEPVCVVQTEGEVFAIRDVCSHAEIPLSEGDIEGTTVECWLHGSRFDLRTGKPTGLPATVPVLVYETKIEDDQVLVRLES